jgi:DNA-binding GntR family transcriptional regulator
VTQFETPESHQQQDSSLGISALHTRLRKMILEGVYPPGTLIPQEELARTLGVSRTPLREVLRLLQKEGLVEAGRYQRSRVAPFEPADLDNLYAGRIQLETLGITLTVPHLQQEDLDELSTLLDEMRNASGVDEWEVPHRRFHQLLVSRAGKQLCSIISNFSDQSYSYRRIRGQVEAHTKSISMVEHGMIMEACRAYNRELAAQQLARHLARTALSVLANLAPEYDPVAVRTALQLAQASTTLAEETYSAKRRSNIDTGISRTHTSSTR